MKLKTCRECSIEFTPSHPSQAYCNEHFKGRKSKAPKKQIKVCLEPNCVNLVDRKHPSQTRCAEHFIGSVDKNPILRSYQRIRSRAREKNLEFNLTLHELTKLFPNDMICPVMGIKMEFGDITGRNTSPSIDRVDPSKGYISGNLQVMCKLANSMKQNATNEELIKFANWITKTYNT